MGWDGDALAESLEQALERRQQAEDERRARRESTTAEERERIAREESVRLSRVRLEAQLERATSPAHRAMLKRALQALGEETTAAEGAQGGNKAGAPEGGTSSRE